MIKVHRSPNPDELTVEKRRTLTEEYMKTKKNVWDKPYIKTALFKMSHGKCVFCECKLGEESKYMEIEHFYPKSLYPEKVVDWNNLLPICNRCNVKKHNHDTKNYPIVNPTIDTPKDHLFMRNYRFKGKDQLGHDTINVLLLNDFDRLMEPRFQIGNKVVEMIEDLYEEIVALGDLGESNKTKINSRIGRLKNLLRSCLPDKEYSVTCSYALFGEEKYYITVNILKEYDYWDEEFKTLQNKALENCLIDAKRQTVSSASTMPQA